MSAVEENQRILQTLKGVDFFSKLNMGDLEQLLMSLKRASFPKGHAIIKEGEIGDTFYMISRGKVSVWKKKGFFSKDRLATLGPSQFFGEMALVTNDPRGATVIADEDAELFVLYKKEFKQLLLNNPEIEKQVKEVLQTRKLKNKLR